MTNLIQLCNQSRSELKEYTWEKVEWSWERYGDTIRLTSKLMNIQTNRQFQLDEEGYTRKQWFWKNCLAAQTDLLERLNFIWMATHGMLDDPPDGVEINI